MRCPLGLARPSTLDERRPDVRVVRVCVAEAGAGTSIIVIRQTSTERACVTISSTRVPVPPPPPRASAISNRLKSFRSSTSARVL